MKKKQESLSKAFFMPGKNPLFRKAQDAAGGAAMLLVIITVMILLYLLFLPDDTREELLGEGGGNNNGDRWQGSTGDRPIGFQNLLLSQIVGRIYPPAPNEVEHTIPSFTIFTNVNAKELSRKSNLIVKKGAFSDSPGSMTFVHDPSTTTNLLLSFNVKKTSGNLIIKLNDEEIFNSELNSGSPAPILLPESLLKPRNEIVFESSSAGSAFWRINTHELYNVILSGEVTDRSAATSDQHFSIPVSEYEAMHAAELRFLPNCDAKAAGRLRIEINSKELYSGFADCGVPNRVEVAKELLQAGDNTLTFVSDFGQYLVDLVKLTTKIQGQDIPVFYFNLPNYVYDRYGFNDALLFVSMRFTDFRSLKTGVLNINGFETTFQTQDVIYQTQVDPQFLLPGPNSIMIIPQGTPLDISELKVETT